MKKWLLFSAAVLLCQSSVLARPWAEIKKSGYITLAGDGEYEGFTKGETGKMEGFEVDLAAEIFKRLGIKTRWIKDDFNLMFSGVNKGKYDIVMSSVTITAERQKIVDFTDPIYCTGMVFVVKNNMPVDPAALKNKKIAVRNNSSAEEYLKRRNYPYVLPYTTRTLAKSNVAFGKADALLDDEIAGLQMLKSPLGKSVKLKMSDLVTRDEIAIVLPKNQNDLKKAINGALAQVVADGTYAKLTKKWLPRDMSCQ